MRSGLPSLYALHIFEAAARHENFTRAAEEFRISQGAVSHQIRALEADLGVALFHRAGRAVRVTEQGADLARAMRDGLAMIRTQIERIALSTRDAPPEVKVATTTYFASRWLSVRLGGFMRDFPGVGVSIVHRPADHADNPAPIEIRWGDGVWDAPSSELLFETPLQPVCAPQLLVDPTRRADVGMLAAHPLLHDSETHSAWQHWLGAAGYGGLVSPRGPTIADPNVRMQAAVDGQGFALADDLLAAELQSGALVAPFGEGIGGYGYYLLLHQDPLDPAQAAFTEWLRHEVRLFAPEGGG